MISDLWKPGLGCLQSHPARCTFVRQTGFPLHSGVVSGEESQKVEY